MTRRDHITMDAAEVLPFLDEERAMACATFGPRRWPHLMTKNLLTRATWDHRKLGNVY